MVFDRAAPQWGRSPMSILVMDYVPISEFLARLSIARQTDYMTEEPGGLGGRR